MEEKMRIFAIVLLSLLFIVSCENPVEPRSEDSLYKGQIVQESEAPFLLNMNSLAKVQDGYVVLDDVASSGVVFGSQENKQVYAARGGEVLPKNTWVGSTDGAAFQASLAPNVVISFAKPETITLLGAKKVIYLDANGNDVLFSGDGIITTSRISTRNSGSNTLGKTSAQAAVTIITEAEFGIGGDGGDLG